LPAKFNNAVFQTIRSTVQAASRFDGVDLGEPPEVARFLRLFGVDKCTH
jgi:hypothetical protein